MCKNGLWKGTGYEEERKQATLDKKKTGERCTVVEFDLREKNTYIYLYLHVSLYIHICICVSMYLCVQCYLRLAGLLGECKFD